MAVKLNLDQVENLTYKRTVAIPTPDGKALKIEFTFKHRTREQIAEMFDAYLKKAQAAADEETAAAESGAERPPLVESAKAAIARDVETVVDIATGWNVEAYAFNEENLAKFFRLYPGAASAIATDYRVSHTEGRLGN